MGGFVFVLDSADAAEQYYFFVWRERRNVIYFIWESKGMSYNFDLPWIIYFYCFPNDLLVTLESSGI